MIGQAGSEQKKTVNGRAAKGYAIPEGVTDVRAMQQALGVKADGVWGEKTEAAWTNAMNGGGIVAGASHTREDADKQAQYAWTGSPTQMRDLEELSRVIGQSKNINDDDKKFLNQQLSLLGSGQEGEHTKTLYELSMRYGPDEVWNNPEHVDTLSRAYQKEAAQRREEYEALESQKGFMGVRGRELKAETEAAWEASVMANYVAGRVELRRQDLLEGEQGPTATPYPEATPGQTPGPTTTSDEENREAKKHIYVTGQELKDLGWKQDDVGIYKFNQALIACDINTPERFKYFLTMVNRESRYGNELLEPLADSYEKESLGNGKYRGAGYLQLTHDYNYEAFAKDAGDPLIYELGAEYVAQNYAWESAIWYWNYRNFNKTIDDGGDLTAVTQRMGKSVSTGRRLAYEEVLEYYKDKDFYYYD